MPQAQQCIQEIQEEAKNYFRIYISSIHKVSDLLKPISLYKKRVRCKKNALKSSPKTFQDLAEDDLKSVFSAFGPIKTVSLAGTGVPGKHKGYGYIEYSTQQGMTVNI